VNAGTEIAINHLAGRSLHLGSGLQSTYNKQNMTSVV